MKSTFQDGISEECLNWSEQFNDWFRKFWENIWKKFEGISQSILGLALLKSTSSDYFKTIFNDFRITVIIIFFGVGSFKLERVSLREHFNLGATSWYKFWPILSKQK